MCHKTKKAMNTDTVELLRECEAGSKMATNSMEQMMSYIGNEDLKKLLEGKNNEHIKLGAVYGIQRSPFCFRTAVFRSQRPPIC